MTTTNIYRDCYVAFLDILGFRQLVESSTTNVVLLKQIRDITSVTAKPTSGVKETSLGPCLMQVRAFSDSIVIFAPTDQPDSNASNPLAQLLFVVRHLHDRVLKLDTCIRGGVAIGKMYWHPSWNITGDTPKGGPHDVLPLTFGPGLNAAYDLESKFAVFPRVLVDASIWDAVSRDSLSADPLAENGLSIHQCLRIDSTDGRVHLDLLNHRIVRAENEKMKVSPYGFTVTWKRGDKSDHASILKKAKQLAVDRIHQYTACERVRVKYEWLLNYCEVHAAH